MSDQPKPSGPEIIALHLVTVAIALAGKFALIFGPRALGFEGDWMLLPGFLFFFTLLHADPARLWRDGAPGREIAIKVGSGLILGIVAAAILAMHAVPTEGNDTPQAWMWTLLPILLILPVAFMGPVVEAILRGHRANGAPLTPDHLKMSLVFPGFLIATLFLNLAVAGALFLLGAPLWVGLLVMVAAVLICIADAWTAAPEDRLPTEHDIGWAPPAETATAAWTGLGRALRQSGSSALFIGGMIYVSVGAAMPALAVGDPQNLDDVAFIGSIAAMGAIVIGVSLGLMLAGVLAVAAAAWTVCKIKRAHPLTMVDLGQQAAARLFMGGIAHVRPVFDDE